VITRCRRVCRRIWALVACMYILTVSHCRVCFLCCEYPLDRWRVQQMSAHRLNVVFISIRSEVRSAPPKSAFEENWEIDIMLSAYLCTPLSNWFILFTFPRSLAPLIITHYCHGSPALWRLAAVQCWRRASNLSPERGVSGE